MVRIWVSHMGVERRRTCCCGCALSCLFFLAVTLNHNESFARPMAGSRAELACRIRRTRTRTSCSSAVMANRAASATAPVPWKHRGAAGSHPLGLESRAIFSQHLVRNEAMKADFVSARGRRLKGDPVDWLDY